MDILAQIKELQEARGWSNYKLARKSGISESSLNNMFRLKSTPTIPTLESLCKGLGITLSQFFLNDEALTEIVSEQKEMLELWNALPENQRQVLLALLRTLQRNK